MIKIDVKQKKSHDVSASFLKKRLRKFLEKKEFDSDAEVSIAIVDKEKMKIMAKKYLKEDPPTIHNVLSFPFIEGEDKFVYPPDDSLRLGEIVLCYPELKKEAKEEDKSINEKAAELVEHGTLHLLGIHHD